jgi:hypothetical protein
MPRLPPSLTRPAAGGSSRVVDAPVANKDRRQGGTLNEHELPSRPQLRHAAIIAVIGYVMGWGVPFASFSILPKLFIADDAARTSQNILANQGLFVAAIFAFLLNFIGDVVAAWGLYLFLRPVNASVSMFTAWLRIVFATIGLAAVLNLVTAYRLLTRPAALAALGQAQINAQVHVAIGSFNSQFAFGLILFGLYLIMLGWLTYRSGYVPRWLGIVLAINGAGWSVMEAGPYLLPGTDLGFLFVATFGELIFLVWLIGWGTRASTPPSARTVRES